MVSKIVHFHNGYINRPEIPSVACRLPRLHGMNTLTPTLAMRDLDTVPHVKHRCVAELNFILNQSMDEKSARSNACFSPVSVSSQ